MGLHSICSITTSSTHGRVFSNKIKKGKGEKIAPGMGPMYRVRFIDAAVETQASGVKDEGQGDGSLDVQLPPLGQANPPPITTSLAPPLVPHEGIEIEPPPAQGGMAPPFSKGALGMLQSQTSYGPVGRAALSNSQPGSAGGEPMRRASSLKVEGPPAPPPGGKKRVGFGA